jgi:hypothetical protein
MMRPPRRTHAAGHALERIGQAAEFVGGQHTLPFAFGVAIDMTV